MTESCLGLSRHGIKDFHSHLFHSGFSLPEGPGGCKDTIVPEFFSQNVLSKRIDIFSVQFSSISVYVSVWFECKLCLSRSLAFSRKHNSSLSVSLCLSLSLSLSLSLYPSLYFPLCLSLASVSPFVFPAHTHIHTHTHSHIPKHTVAAPANGSDALGAPWKTILLQTRLAL